MSHRPIWWVVAGLALAATVGLYAADGVGSDSDTPSDSTISAADGPSTTSSASTSSAVTTSSSSTTSTVTTTSLAPTTSSLVAADLPTSGTGEFVYASASELVIAGSPSLTFSVATEAGSGVDANEFAAFIDETLRDARGWTSQGAGFRRVQEGGAFTIVVATPETVDDLCRPLATNGIYSCARNGWIAINLHRWLTATEDWPTDLDTYRRYVLNHEVGHYLQGGGHDLCPGPGELAPIMMQQTKGLEGCEPNGWVEPE